MQNTKLKKFLTGALYILPMVFFVVCYFLLTATEEDIAQGAGTTPDVWGDLLAAFKNNARLADMYAWAVISFFDYQYSFGVDTIFRLIDVAAAMGMLVLLTSVVLGRKVEWRMKDALIFAGIFLMIFLTPFGYTLYRGFSMIHNYLIITLALLGFTLPFLWKLRGKEIPKLYRKWWIAVPMGLVFGLSANFPPLAFLATYVIVKLWQWWRIRKNSQDYAKLKLETWEWLMIGGMLVSMVIGYTLGPGVSGYAQDSVYTVSYDYLALGEIVRDFSGSTMRILKHLVVNFGRTLAPVMIILAIGYVLAWVRKKMRKEKLNFLPNGDGEKNTLLVILIFCLFCTLAGTQITMPIRLCLPAYLGLTVVAWILLRNWWGKPSKRELLAAGGIMAILMMIVIGVRGFLAWDFHERVGVILQEVKDSEADEICIDLTRATQRWQTPFNIFQQEETFVPRRTTARELYGKEVVYCQSQ